MSFCSIALWSGEADSSLGGGTSTCQAVLHQEII